MKRNAKAVWQGDVKTGSGKLTTESNVLSDTNYSFQSRFENKSGTNPEELIAAGHAGCFTMALAAELEKVGLHATRVETQASVNVDKTGDGWSITDIQLDVTGEVPGATHDQFNKAATTAKTNCPVSKLFNPKIITMEAKLGSKSSGQHEMSQAV